MPYVDSATRRREIVAAARAAMTRHGVGNTSLRTVAAEAGIPLGTLQHVFPTKDGLFRAVLDDVAAEMADLGADAGVVLDGGLAAAVRTGLDAFWAQLVGDDPTSQVMQLELVAYALRDTGDDGLGPALYARYLPVATELCRRAVATAGETCAVPVEQLGRLLVAGLDGLLVQYLCDPDEDRARADLEVLATMVVHAAGLAPDGATS